MPYRASQDTQQIGASGELTAAEELRVQEIQALSDTAADEALGKLSGSVVKKAVSGDGNYTLPIAAAATLGGVKVGARLTITDGVLAADEQGGSYTLPTATDSILGGVKVGSGLSITEGVLAVTGGSMVYPGAGIPLSTGEAWGDSITNNSANWDTAYVWGNHASAGYVTGTPWTAEGYLTSLSGAVLTDQSTPQTIGLTGSRLAMLWATDITCTNAIAGSVTGNAGTVTGLSVTSGKTLTVSNSLTLTATDGSTLAIGTGGTLGTAAYTASTAYAAALGDNDNYVTDDEKTKLTYIDQDVKTTAKPTFAGAIFSAVVDLANNVWLRAKNYAGTDYINMFKVNEDDEIEAGAQINFTDGIGIEEDSGAVSLVDMPVSSASADGTEMSYTMKIDGVNILKVYALSDGAGGVDTYRVKLLNKASLTMQDSASTEHIYTSDTDGSIIIT